MKTIVLFDEFELPIIKGMEYLGTNKNFNSDYLFINEASDEFSMYFEKDFPIFNIPQNLNRNYSLFEIRKDNKNIKFFCPEKQKSVDFAVWYFYVEILDELGKTHILPGQIRVSFEGFDMLQAKGIPKFIGVLEKIKIYNKCISA